MLSSLDPNMVVFIRTCIAIALFLPLFRPSKLSRGAMFTFFFIGMLEYGAMELFLIHSFQYLDAWNVALMTLFTPIYIIAIDGVLKRKIDWIFLACAFLTVVGAAVSMLSEGCVPPKSLIGCLLIQSADFCFALGILLYRKARVKYASVRDNELYALLFFGALIPVVIGTFLTSGFSDIPSVNTHQWLALVYLGLISSGLCLFLWNVGATKVCTGTLAVLSNIKVPMAVAVSLVVFGERAGSWTRLMIGASIMIVAVGFVQHRAKRIS